MADLNAVDRLQPCLLDRLFDDDPRRSSEGKQDKVVSLSRFKEGIKRDIEWLLNSKCRFDHLDDALYGEVKQSVLNYGLRDFTGLSSENLQPGQLEQIIHRALLFFEPRILSQSLRVRHVTGDGAAIQSINYLSFEISGQFWAEPLPQDFLLRTDILLEDGAVSVS